VHDGRSLLTQRTSGASRRTLVAVTIGNAAEFFDFTVYGFLTITIGKLFFAPLPASAQFLLAVATFGVGFFMRPLGGLVIGAYADRTGRSRAMLLTITLMALGCIAIAVAPTYEAFGLAGPLLLVAGRLLQGFSAGGEIGPSTALLIEHAPAARRGFFGGFQFGSQGLGVATGALLVGILTATLPPAAMDGWGWRVPFLLGLLIAPIGMYLRRQLRDVEPPPPQHAASRGTAHGVFATVWREHRALVIAGTLHIAGGSAATYVIGFYLPTYAIRELGIEPRAALFAAALNGAIMFLLAPAFGALSDRFGRRRTIAVARLALLLIAYPCFGALNTSPDMATLLLAVALLSVVLTAQGSAAITMLPELFPRAMRASGMSLIYSAGVALLGGFAPFLCAWLLQTTGNRFAPVWYLWATTLVSLLALYALPDRTGKELT
jgi:MFS transporter, MHS family, proline/betaine transporter